MHSLNLIEVGQVCERSSFLSSESLPGDGCALLSEVCDKGSDLCAEKDMHVCGDSLLVSGIAGDSVKLLNDNAAEVYGAASTRVPNPASCSRTSCHSETIYLQWS